MKRLREEEPAEPLVQAGKGFADSLIDVFSMDTIPADLMSDGDTPPSGTKNPVDAIAPAQPFAGSSAAAGVACSCCGAATRRDFSSSLARQPDARTRSLDRRWNF